MTVAAGEELGPWTVDVERAKMRTFSVVLDDPNPIHLDPEAVRAAGLGDRVINQGPASFAYVLNMLRESVPGVQVRELDVRLTANVFDGDRVCAAGRVDSVHDSDAERVIACSVWLDVVGGPRALRGTATLALPAEN